MHREQTSRAPPRSVCWVRTWPKALARWEGFAGMRAALDHPHPPSILCSRPRELGDPSAKLGHPKNLRQL